MNKVLISLTVIFTAVILFSCSSVPKKEYDRTTATRAKTTKYDIKDYAPKEFEIAEVEYQKATAWVNEKKEGKQAKASLNIAETNYNAVIEIGIPQYAKVVETEVIQEKKKADGIKASITEGIDYTNAENEYKAAMDLMEAGAYYDAVDLFTSAKANYMLAYTNASEKMQKSQAVLDDVKAKMNKIDQTLAQIQSIESSMKTSSKK